MVCHWHTFSLEKLALYGWGSIGLNLLVEYSWPKKGKAVGVTYTPLHACSVGSRGSCYGKSTTEQPALHARLNHATSSPSSHRPPLPPCCSNPSRPLRPVPHHRLRLHRRRSSEVWLRGFRRFVWFFLHLHAPSTSFLAACTSPLPNRLLELRKGPTWSLQSWWVRRWDTLAHVIDRNTPPLPWWRIKTSVTLENGLKIIVPLCPPKQPKINFALPLSPYTPWQELFSVFSALYQK